MIALSRPTYDTILPVRPEGAVVRELEELQRTLRGALRA